MDTKGRREQDLLSLGSIPRRGQIQTIFGSLSPATDGILSSVHDTGPVNTHRYLEKSPGQSVPVLTGTLPGNALLVSLVSFSKKLLAEVLHSKESMRK